MRGGGGRAGCWGGGGGRGGRACRIAHDQACRARARRVRRVFGLIQLQALPWPLMIRGHSAGDADYSRRSHVACTAPEEAAVYLWSFDLGKHA
jgi:hypothetical protein